MSALANINIAFTADLKQFSTQMQSATRQMKKVGKNLQNVGKKMSVGITAPIVGLGGVSLKSAADLEVLETSFESMVGSGSKAKSLLKELTDFTAKTPFQLDGVGKAAKQLLSFGVQQDQLLSKLKFLGDISAGANVPLSDMAAIFGKVKAKGKAMTEEILQLSDRGIPIIDILANKFGIAKDQVFAMAKEGKISFSLLQDALKSMTDQGGIFNEQMAKQSETLHGLYSTIKDNLVLGFAELGKEIAETFKLKDLAKQFIGRIQELVGWFKRLNPETKKSIIIFGGIAAAVGPVLVALGYLMTNVIPGLITVFGGLKAAVAATSVAFKSLTVWIASNPFGALLIALGAVVAYFVLFRKETDKVVKTQSILTQINNEATKSIAAEKAKLVELVSIAKDERINKNQRIRAIKELNKLSPKYLGDLNLETINTDKARKALEKYNEELLKVAKVKAAQAKLQEIQSKIIDLELKQAKNLVDGEKNRADEVAKVTANDQINLEQKETLLKVLNQGNVISEIANNQLLDKIALLKEEEKLVLDIIKANNINASSGSVTPEPETGKRKKAKTLLEGDEKQKASLDGLVKGVKDKREKLNTELKGIQDDFIDFSIQMSDIITNGVTSFLSGIGEMIGGLILGAVSMADVGGMMLKVVGDLVTQLGEAAIQVGVGMLAIQSAFSNPFAAIAAGVALVAIGSVISSIASQFSGGQESGGVTPFANGGIVYGPTNALIGEYAGASSNPEVVAPLSKLKELITPASQNLQISLGGELTADAGRLKAVLDRYDVRKSRTS
ncbi:tape measure protein [Tenacibaculum sp. Mcav3-52]|uniref:tape measure protein n=1 Tax=Tenacibaculum sp. Mcav3-52 TaxID=2917762 RepID=UPI001EF39EBB|nr:tape measure protein [Tenacibaculum sp. Mcav3-52]MCG7502381.1 tape measure protein [Tenacibaculum sp. Mcav3-52]